MTERRRRSSPRAVIAGAAATFLAVLALLSFQLHAGHDPALGSGRQAVALRASGHTAPVVTRASGGGGPVTASHSGAHHAQAAVVTRASGAGGRNDDE
jgi:hypothetical protein